MTISRPYPLTSNTQLAPCRVSTTANLAGNYFNGNTNNGVGATIALTATGALTIDSVVLNAGDYVLVNNQTLAYQNGIYQVTTPGNASTAALITRRPDFQNIEQMQLGAFVNVFAGSTLAGSTFVMVEPFPAAIGVPTVSGSNNITFAA